MHSVAFFTPPLPTCAPHAAENASAVRTRYRGSHHTPARNRQHRGARPALATHLNGFALGAPADLVPRGGVKEIGKRLRKTAVLVDRKAGCCAGATALLICGKEHLTFR